MMTYSDKQTKKYILENTIKLYYVNKVSLLKVLTVSAKLSRACTYIVSNQKHSQCESHTHTIICGENAAMVGWLSRWFDMYLSSQISRIRINLSICKVVIL